MPERIRHIDQHRSGRFRGRIAGGHGNAGWIGALLFPPTSLADAMHRLGFVQADPIRAPARAQDLILRHRMRGYRAGDLDQSFGRLRLEEDFVYAYGLMPAETRHLLHPRLDPADEVGLHAPAGLAAEVLAFVRDRGLTHSGDLKARFGRERAVNGLGRHVQGDHTGAGRPVPPRPTAGGRSARLHSGL
jgi:hypothetical protein